jgi:uncharacterized protein (TIGR00730 family)
LNRICVNCGSSPGGVVAYQDSAIKLGKYLGEKNIDLVYGGADVGLMGVIANAALNAGGNVIGVITKSLAAKVQQNNVTELIIVNTMHERKMKMFELSDAFIALPGGFGTFEELFEILTWAQLSIHHKPIGVLNVNNFYNKLFDFLDHAVEQRFIKEEHRKLFIVSKTPEELYQNFLKYTVPVVEKWIDRKS